MNIQSAINAAIEQQDLSESDMIAVMRTIMTGEATSAQIAGFLVALRIKGETVTEIAAAASVMRELATKVEVSGDHLVDIVGTGGDGARLFNVSTAFWASIPIGPILRMAISEPLFIFLPVPTVTAFIGVFQFTIEPFPLG